MSNNIQSVKSKKDFNSLHNSEVVFVTKCLVIKYLDLSSLQGSSITVGMCIKKKVF